MTRHRSPSPEDRFNDKLDALVSGLSTPEANDDSADTNAEPSMPVDAARELHSLARANDSRQGSPPEHVWESIMNSRSPSIAATIGGKKQQSRSSVKQPSAPESTNKCGESLAPRRAPVNVTATLPYLKRAASIALVVVIVAVSVALISNLPPDGHEEAPPVRLPAMIAGQPATPSSTSIADVSTCLANNGLVYRTTKLSASEVTSKVTTSVDGEDQVVSTKASSVFASGEENIAIGIGFGAFTARELTTGEMTILGFDTSPRIERLQFGPWVVAPGNPYRTNWFVTYLPTMEQTHVSSAFPGDELDAFTVTPKVSADGTTLALIVTPDDSRSSGTTQQHPVAPSVLVTTAHDPDSISRLPIASPDLATYADLVAVSPDGALVSAPAVLSGASDLTLAVDVFSVASLKNDPPVSIVAEAQLEYPVHEGFAFFSPSGNALRFAVDGAINTLMIDDIDESPQSGTYQGTLYGAVIAPGGEGALVGFRHTPAESPSAWMWVDGATGEVHDLYLDHLMFADVHGTDDQPPVFTASVVELTGGSRESGPSFVFFDVTGGTVTNEIRDLGGDRPGGIGGYWSKSSPDGSLILTRLDDEAFIKANRPSTDERWDIPVPESISATRLDAFPSPDGSCIALTSADTWSSNSPQPIWVIAAKPDAEPILVAEGWFSNWYKAPVSMGR